MVAENNNMEGYLLILYKLKFINSSDHRPVYAKFETEINVPYLGNPPLHLRKRHPDGFIRINSIILEYDLLSLNSLSEFLSITFPFEMLITFSGNFLKNITSTISKKIDKVKIIKIDLNKIND